MATIPTFRTWVAGEIVTAAYMNANVRDGGNFFLAQPVAELRQTVAQTLTSGVYGAILLDTEDADTDNAHSTVTNTSRYTSPTAGRLLCGGAVSFVANGTGVRVAQWGLNGANVNGGSAEIVPHGTIAVSVPARLKTIAVNGTTDYVELFGFQNSGGNLNTDSGTGVNQAGMSIFWIHT